MRQPGTAPSARRRSTVASASTCRSWKVRTVSTPLSSASVSVRRESRRRATRSASFIVVVSGGGEGARVADREPLLRRALVHVPEQPAGVAHGVQRLLLHLRGRAQLGHELDALGDVAHVLLLVDGEEQRVLLAEAVGPAEQRVARLAGARLEALALARD